MPNPECEEPTVASPMMQKEKPMRLYADIAHDAEWFEQQSASCGGDNQHASIETTSQSDARMSKLDKIADAIGELIKNAEWCENRMDAIEQRRVEECM